VEAEVRGALAVAGTFAGRAAGAQTAMIDGFVGAVWAQGGRPRAVFEFRIAHGKIVTIEMVADPDGSANCNWRCCPRRRRPRARHRRRSGARARHR
jgi:hypothetical protein